MKIFAIFLLAASLMLSGCAVSDPEESAQDHMATDDSIVAYPATDNTQPPVSAEDVWEDWTIDDELRRENELVMEVAAALDEIVFSAPTLEIGFQSLSDSQKIVYAVNYYDMEVQNGGLCQFFVNSSSMVAPFLSEYLQILGANSHQDLFDSFVQENSIDLSNLTSFEISSIEEYLYQYKRYPFDQFDDAFYALEPLTGYLSDYIEANKEDFQ